MRIPLVLTIAVALACSDSSAPAKTPPSQLARVTIVSGASQQGTVGAALSTPIVIMAVDSNGHPAVGLSAIFGPSGDGSANPASATTDSTGKASTVWTLTTTAGPDTLLFAVTQPNSNDVVMGTVYATATP